MTYGAVSTNSGNEVSKTSHVIGDVIRKVRNLKRDVTDSDLVMDVLNEVGLLDDSLKTVNREVSGMTEHCTDLHVKRKTVEGLVRSSLDEESKEFRTKTDFNHALIRETEKRMTATDRAPSAILSSVVATLDKSKVSMPGSMDNG